jgi:ribosomal protein L37AE/L43A
VPCHGCASRQTDPERGPSAWKRLVVSGEQVLVCPDCARKPGWDSAADRCPSCGSSALSKTLGVCRCRACGATTSAGGDAAVRVDGPRSASDLSAEVDAALNRIFGRSGT